MFPQAELENYKLQVELLQEKLQRSEDNRQQLEHKLDKVLQKRSELDKSVRHKSRQKYQEFLEEQTKRNERNKKLVHMLERIDEQTAAMSQRSERLKMMKLQYQMYFAKLVQNQTMRCIQQTTASAPATAGGVIPVLVQPQPQATNPQPTPQPWTFAMATPTQAGMLLTPQFAAASPVPPAPHTNAAGHPVYYPELFGGTAAPLGTSNLFDLRATLRAFDNENADLPERMHPLLTGDYQADLGGSGSGCGSGSGRMPPEATPTSTVSSSQEKGARKLSSTSSTLATSSLTFDKLPKTSSSPSLTLTELPTAGAGTTSGQDVGGQPQRETGDLDAWTNSRVTKVEYEKSPTVVGHNEHNGQRRWPDQQQQQQQQQQEHQIRQQPEQQQHQEVQQQYQQPQQQHQQPHDFEAYFGELKIDESWQDGTRKDKRPLNVRSGEQGSAAGGKVGISNDLLDEVKASRAALEKAAAAVDEQLARGNQLSPPRSHELTAGVSIENIENAIYGERLTGGGSGGGGGAGGATATAGEVDTPTQGFFETMVTNTSPEELQEVEKQQQQQQQQQQPKPESAGYGQYDASSYGDVSEPIYASIDSAGQPTNAKAEPLYSEIGNPTDYQPYAADAGAVGEVPPEMAGTTEAPDDASGAEVLPQEYSNIDYGNYEAGQYESGYDPNAYPGYIYDEATGQYIADPNATQYAPDGSYAGQDYDAGAVQNYDYSAYEQQPDQQQQQLQQQQQQEQHEELPAQEQLMQEQQQQEAYPVGEIAAPEGAESPAVAAAAPPEPPVTNKPLKPTSILSTTDKQAAPNDAQQQQQQQLKKKKRVNFVDSSETDDSSSVKPTPIQAANPGPTASSAPNSATPPVGGSESDFDFSTGSEAKN
ncbi:mediator of RNA polymerase II transcription subunit 15 [Drosophila elegans]|uniref:mediator of RNA polymerase II transcription subunit 15 n=1 Tax=Drosophila elegans TaxID=30023 RepID=UPI0007E7892E|nr:mediator of RNA polymerase II transcription subunit 15 [Drosophila elegans]